MLKYAPSMDAHLKMNTNQQIPKIVQLLWDGKTSKAKKLITLESARLEAQATELKEALVAVEADITTMHSLTPQSGQMSSGEAGQQAAQIQRLTLAQKRTRHTEILSAADALLQNKEEFTTGEVAEILLESGIVMGVQDSRITTAISGILKQYKDKYKRIEKGVYKKVNHDLLEQGSHKDI